MEEGYTIEPVNMGQAMAVGAMTINNLITAFIKPDDSEKDKVTATYICLAVFFHCLCAPAKHKDKMIGILEAIIADLKDPA